MNKNRIKYLKFMGQKLLILLYPDRCIVCDKILPFGKNGCCERCRTKLYRNSGAVCMKCGKPLRDERREYCFDCSNTYHFYDQGIGVYIYFGAIRDVLYRLKYQNRRDYVPFLVQQMVEELEKKISFWKPQCVIPIPMYCTSKRKRGYNQAELFAKELSKQMGIPLEKNLLRCVRKTASQKTLNRQERMDNLKDAFHVQGYQNGLRRVLIIDDVYTTGSTMDEAARTLKAYGIQQVNYVVLCIGKEKIR